MIMTQKLLFGLIALLAAAPELVNVRTPVASDEPHVDVADGAASSPQTLRAEGVALARRGSESHEAGNYPQAVARFDSAALKLPQIADWLHAFAASSLSFTGDTLEVERRVATTDSLMTHEWGWRTRARAYFTARAYARAAGVATAAARGGASGKRAAAWLYAAEIQKELGNSDQQRSALLRAVDVAPYSDAGVDAARFLAEFDRLSAKERLQVGRTLIRSGESKRGIAMLRSFMSQTSDAALREQVRYEIGIRLFNSGDYRAAERELKKIPSSHARAADARFVVARSQYRQDKEKTGAATFRKVAADYPRSRAATRALFFLGDLAQDDNRITDAMKYFRQTAARHKLGGDEPALALMRLGAIQYLRKDYAAAAATFATYRERHPKGVAYEQATFWAARAASARGDKETSRKLLQELDARHSYSYYDVRASQLLGHDVLKDLPPGPPVDTTSRPRLENRLERWLLLRDIGWNEAAAFELARLKREVAGNNAALYTIGEELNARGHAYAGIATGRELLQNGEAWNARLLRIMYPLPYQNIIEREARSRGLDPYFVAALMRQESRFNARAVSGAGAIGLMQVMPATGRQLGRGQNVGAVTAETLKDPEINIRLGTKFLADLMNMYDERQDAVLAAYNAGPTRMDRWQNFPEFATPDLFVERIPFDETRDYVKVVRVNASIYRALYGG